jgi:hypothetical protein
VRECLLAGLLHIRFSAVAAKAPARNTLGMPHRRRKRVETDDITPAIRRVRTIGTEQSPFRRWSAEEDGFVFAQCAAMTDAEMGRKLGRSRSAVLARRLKWLGLCKAAPLSMWTLEEDSMLRDLYGGVDTIFLAAMLARPPEALRSRAFYLNLRMRKTWSLEEDEILRAHYPRTPVPVFAWLLPGRTDRNIYHRAGVLGIERGHAYVLSTWDQRHHAYPPELRSLIRLHHKVQRKLQDVEAQH